MSIDTLPFAEQQASGLDALAGAPSLMANAMTDIADTRKARPGITAWAPFSVAAFGSPVDMMVGFGDFLYFVLRDRRYLRLDTIGHTTTLVSAHLPGSLKPQGIRTRTGVSVVGGGSIFSAGPLAKAIAGIATRLVVAVNDDSGTFQWSGLGDAAHSSWDPLDFAEAEAKPDIIQNIAANTNELFVFGAETIQVYSPDPDVAFAPGRTLNLGMLAPYSLVEVDDQFAFLDRERRFVLTDGRSFSDGESVLSKPIESVLRSMTTVEDCWGFRMRTDRWDAAVWFFPTEGRGFIWNRRNRGWSEWRGWGANGWQASAITSAYYWPEKNVFLVGLENGSIAKLDATAVTDLGDPIRIELTTGFVDRGNDNLKKCDAVKFIFKRGDTAQLSTAPRVQVSWRDDLGAFCQPSVMDLGRAGDYEPTLELRSLGSYRRRQWKVEYTGDAGFTFVGAREQFQVLDN